MTSGTLDVRESGFDLRRTDRPRVVDRDVRRREPGPLLPGSAPLRFGGTDQGLLRHGALGRSVLRRGHGTRAARQPAVDEVLDRPLTYAERLGPLVADDRWDFYSIDTAAAQGISTARVVRDDAAVTAFSRRHRPRVVGMAGEQGGRRLVCRGQRGRRVGIGGRPRSMGVRPARAALGGDQHRAARSWFRADARSRDARRSPLARYPLGRAWRFARQHSRTTRVRECWLRPRCELYELRRGVVPAQTFFWFW